MIETQKCFCNINYFFCFFELFNHQKSLAHKIIVESDLTLNQCFLDQCVQLNENICVKVCLFRDAKVDSDSSPVPRVCEIP